MPVIKYGVPEPKNAAHGIPRPGGRLDARAGWAMPWRRTLIGSIASDRILQDAFDHVCAARKNAHPNNDIWHLRFHWRAEKRRIQTLLRTGRFRFSPCRALRIGAHSVGIWNAADTVVQKAMTLVLSDTLKPSISRHCTHVKGYGGLKAAVSKVAQYCALYPLVLKSDVRSYYASIDHTLLLAQLEGLIDDPVVIDLLAQFLNHLDDVDGTLIPVVRGINKGSSLSPLLGAIYLADLDQALGDHAKRHGLGYLRYRDDWIVLCHSKRQLRRAARLTNQVLARLRLSKAADKTFIGWIKKELDFLGYRLGPHAASGVEIARKTWVNFRDKQIRLYEQGASPEALGAYVRRWWIWARSGVELKNGMREHEAVLLDDGNLTGYCLN